MMIFGINKYILYAFPANIGIDNALVITFITWHDSINQLFTNITK